MHAYNQDFINGIWTGSSGAKTTTVVDPTTEVPCATVRHSAADDVNRAAIAASRAFPAWATTAPEARAALLDRALSNMAEMADEFVKGMAGEIGVAVWFGRILQVPMGSGKNLGRYAASWIACWPKRPSSTAALT